MSNLSAEHRADLEKSGWNAETIEANGIYSVPPSGINRILGNGSKGDLSLMAIPYPDADFTRYKLFPPCKLKKDDPKPRKYHQAPGSPLVLYRPAGFNPEASVIRITEGEKKAGKGTQEGLNVCGLGGIWNFAAKDDQGNNVLIEDLDGINWTGKTVELIPDGDFQFKEGVRHAVYRLGLMLEQKGASVKIVRLPADQKLDDYLCAQKVEDFRTLVRLTLEDHIFRVESLKEHGLEHAIWDSLIGVQDFIALDLPPLPNIMKPWLKAKTLAMIYSKRGVGKTMLASSIALAVTRKGAIGPWAVENPVPTLYLDGEMTVEELKERLTGLSTSLPDQVAPLFILSNEAMARKGWPRINLCKEESREAVEKVIRGTGISLLIVDNLASLTPGIDENAKQAWDDVNQWCLGLKFQGVAVILVHHAGKGGDQRGTGGREDNLDIVVRLTHPKKYRAEDGCKFTVDFTKGRSIYGADASSFSLQLIEEDGGLSWTYAEVGKKDLILALLGNGVAQKEIAELAGCDKSYVTVIKKKAVSDDVLDNYGEFTEEGRAQYGHIDVERYLVGC